MAKEKFICVKCGSKSSKWKGKCSVCNEWNSYIDILEKNKESSSKDTKKPILISNIQSSQKYSIKTGIHEFDRVLGEGISLGSFILLAGKPGIGKSTLLLQVVGELSKLNKKVLYISGEELLSQIAKRAQRIGINGKNILMLEERTWERVKEQVKFTKPDFLIIDSIQTLHFEDKNSFHSGSNIRELTSELLEFTKELEVTTILIGHITKEGSIAGPKLLEHMVDVVLYFDLYKEHRRVLSCSKNRYGTTQEIGLFDMTANGLIEFSSTNLIEYENEEEIGNISTLVKNGNRIGVTKIESLVVDTVTSVKRVSNGIDQKKVNMIIALIEKYLGLNFSFKDVYVNVESINNQECIDLAIASSLISSYKGCCVENKSLFLGKLSLSGRVSTYELKSNLKLIASYGIRKIISNYADEDQLAELNLKVDKLTHIKELDKIIA